MPPVVYGGVPCDQGYMTLAYLAACSLCGRKGPVIPVRRPLVRTCALHTPSAPGGPRAMGSRVGSSTSCPACRADEADASGYRCPTLCRKVAFARWLKRETGKRPEPAPAASLEEAFAKSRVVEKA